jgi:3-deoxy-manno-octulosonate cytidylyltransferase (CMP-KDO synthetase)
MNPIVLIPIRLASTRLAEKALADIHGKPMAEWVWEKATQANIGPVVVACDHEAVYSLIKARGGQAVMTDPTLPSGSDRIWSALKTFDPDGTYNIIVNLQGDLPTINPATIHDSLKPLENLKVDIATLAVTIKDEEEKLNPNVVKVVLAGNNEEPIRRAVYFSRQPIPYGNGPLYHHVGIYCYRRKALERFIQLPPSQLEQQERLEQLRALEAGMRIDVCVIDKAPGGVDTQEDLEKARESLKSH